MPNPLPVWNKENLDQVISDLYSEAIRNETLHQQLLNDPYTVIGQRIQIPPEYQKNFLAKLECNPGVMLNVPPFQGDVATPANPDPSIERVPYNIICTMPW